MKDSNEDKAQSGPALEGDLIDLDRLRLSQDFSVDLGVKKTLLTIPVGKSNRHSFFRTHPDPAYRWDTAVLEIKEDRETYLVDPSLRRDIAGDLKPKRLFAAITRQNVLFILPVKLPGVEGRLDEWSRTLMEAAEMAMTKWVRVASNMALGAYEVFEATGTLPEPEWPEIDFQEILQIAFKGRIINSPDHPVLRKLRGER